MPAHSLQPSLQANVGSQCVLVNALKPHILLPGKDEKHSNVFPNTNDDCVSEEYFVWLPGLIDL